MDTLLDYERVLEKVKKEKENKKKTIIQKWVEHEEIRALIRKWISEKKTEKEILSLLNLLLASPEVRQRFNLPMHRLAVYRKHLHDVFLEEKRRLRDGNEQA